MKPKVLPAYCKHEDCRKVLTQPYAIEMGECVSCCLVRIRADRGDNFYLTSRKKIKQARAYHAKKRALQSAQVAA